MKEKNKIFVLDTNVLIHDPSALLHFKEHDVYLPIVVLEELDRAKVGLSEVARNVRQVSRMLDELVEKANGNLQQGIKLPSVSAEPLMVRLRLARRAEPSTIRTWPSATVASCVVRL